MKLAVDLQKIEKYFPLERDPRGGLRFELIIDRHRFDDVKSILSGNGITDPQFVQEFCFIVLWIENYIGKFDGAENYPEEFHRMWPMTLLS